MINLIDGKFRFDIMCVLRALIGPIMLESELNHKLTHNFEIQEKLRAWEKRIYFYLIEQNFPTQNLKIISVLDSTCGQLDLNLTSIII